jgi:hypothetical protein
VSERTAAEAKRDKSLPKNVSRPKNTTYVASNLSSHINTRHTRESLQNVVVLMERFFFGFLLDGEFDLRFVIKSSAFV